VGFELLKFVGTSTVARIADDKSFVFLGCWCACWLFLVTITCCPQVDCRRQPLWRHSHRLMCMRESCTRWFVEATQPPSSRLASLLTMHQAVPSIVVIATPHPLTCHSSIRCSAVKNVARKLRSAYARNFAGHERRRSREQNQGLREGPAFSVTPVYKTNLQRGGLVMENRYRVPIFLGWSDCRKQSQKGRLTTRRLLAVAVFGAWHDLRRSGLE